MGSAGLWSAGESEPVLSALTDAIVHATEDIACRSRQLLEAADQARLRGTHLSNELDPEITAAVVAVQEAVKHWRELVDWLARGTPPVPVSELFEAIDRLLKMGVPREWAGSISEGLSNRQKGAPAKRRDLFIRALELRLIEGTKKWTWTRLADKLCDCGSVSNGQPAHTHACRENIRFGVHDVERFLKEHQIDLPNRSARQV